jgi:hypothetical protein
LLLQTCQLSPGIRYFKAYLYCSQDGRQAKEYYERFLALARKEEKPTEELSEMIEKADSLLRHTNWGKVKSQGNNKYNE